MNRHLGKGIPFMKVIRNSRKRQQKLHLTTVHLLRKSKGCRTEVILTFCVSRVLCCLGQVGGCASTC